MVDQAYNDETQRAAIPRVRDGQNAVDQSRTRTNALSSAQKYDMWGNEIGPQLAMIGSIRLFSGISDVLATENNLITKFISEMEHAMDAAKHAEWDAELAFREVSGALDGVASSDEATKHTEALKKIGFTIKENHDQESTTDTQNGSQSGANQSTQGSHNQKKI